MEIKFNFNKKLSIGTYLDMKISKNNVSLLYKGEEIYKEKSNKYSKFIGRKLKAVIIKSDKDELTAKVLRFADIHRHSGYSLLDGANHIKDIVRKTDYVGALTDHGNMYGFLDYYKQMKKSNKQPIVGFEAYAENIEGEKKGNHLILLAKNEAGYKNLLKLTSKAYENFYNKPHVSYEMLKEHSKGIIATSACIGGEIPQLLKEDYEKAREVALEYKLIFGEDFYLEIQRHNIGKEEDDINKGLLKLSKDTGIKLVAATDSHYAEKEDAETHEVLLCIQTGSTLGNSPMRFEGEGYHIHSAEEMEEKFSDIPEALDNTLEIAEKCSGFSLNLNEVHMPEFDIPKEHTEDSYFEKLVYQGFDDRFKGTEKHSSKEYLDRVKFEMKVIKEMKYSSYFLIVADFISFARKNDIMVGPGRGSAAGSLVSYCLGIVDLDPVAYDLLFERFLNPERISLPDIDSDFCYERREEVIDYIKNKYGEDSVSRIITFGTLAAKSVVRDVAKVMNFPYSFSAKISKAIPNEVDMTIDKAMEVNPELAELYSSDEDVRSVINIARKLEGLPRHASQHACGLGISKGRIDNFLPEALMGKKGEKKERTSQVNMNEVEELGIIKMDILGLRTMTVIGRAINSINRCEGIGLKYKDIPISDPYVFESISRGKTYGVFQLESAGMRGFMKELYEDVSFKIKKVENKFNLKGYHDIVGKGDREGYLKEMTNFGNELFERLIAGISLYRPGPMDVIPQYIKGMNNPDRIKYDTPELEPILKATYGEIIYQEQVIMIVQELAGYSLGRADIVRRAMGKKEIDVMEKEKEYFIDGKLDENGNIEVPGCVRKGIEREVAEKIWAKMEDFCRYAFNKSHAAAYALLAIITAWLKHYYPTDFMSETLNSFMDKSDKIEIYLSVCKDMGIEILPPDINVSSERFARNASDSNIVFGLKGIRNLGKVSALLIKERETRGQFKDYQDTVVRMMKHQDINKKVLEGLIYSGSLDRFEGTRRAKIEHLPALLKHSKIESKSFHAGQINLLDICDELSHLREIKTPTFEEFHKRYMLDKEKEYAGFYVTEHPLDEYVDYFKGENISEIGFLKPELDENEEGVSTQAHSIDGTRVKIAGIVKNVKTFYAKKSNNPLKVFQIEGKTGTIDAIMFYKQIQMFGNSLNEGEIIIADGVMSDDDRGLQLIVNEIVDIDALKRSKQHIKALAINIRNNADMDKLKATILNNANYEGSVPLIIVKDKQKLRYNKGVNVDLKLISVLDNSFGENYRLIYKSA